MTHIQTTNTSKLPNSTYIKQLKHLNDFRYHSDHELVVTLSTGWHNGRSIHMPRRKKFLDLPLTVPPNKIVNASPAVWKALGIPNIHRLETKILLGPMLDCLPLSMKN